MVVQTLLVLSAVALIGYAAAEEAWIPVPLGRMETAIDFSTSVLQLRMVGFGDASRRYQDDDKDVSVIFNSGPVEETGGIRFSHGFENSWKLMYCSSGHGTLDGATGDFTVEQLSQEPDVEDIFTIWREDTLKLNLMINDNVVLDNYAVLDEITEWSCDDGKTFADNFGKKVTTVSFSATQSSGKAEDYLKGYRIIPRTGDEKNAGQEGEKEREKQGEQEGEKEGEKEGREDYSRGSSCLNSLLLLSTALFIALSFS